MIEQLNNTVSLPSAQTSSGTRPQANSCPIKLPMCWGTGLAACSAFESPLDPPAPLPFSGRGKEDRMHWTLRLLSPLAFPTYSRILAQKCNSNNPGWECNSSGRVLA